MEMMVGGGGKDVFESTRLQSLKVNGRILQNWINSKLVVQMD
jgi:hypothetical protein